MLWNYSIIPAPASQPVPPTQAPNTDAVDDFLPQVDISNAGHCNCRKSQIYLIVWSLFQHTVTNWKVKLIEERGMMRLEKKVLKRRQVSRTVNIRMMKMRL